MRACNIVCMVGEIECACKKNLLLLLFFFPFAESKGAVVKVKRQAWTATAIAAFFEGLCEVCWIHFIVLYISCMLYNTYFVCVCELFCFIVGKNWLN